MIATTQASVIHLDGFEDARIGSAQSYATGLVIAYSLPKVLEILKERGLDSETAWDYYQELLSIPLPGSPVFITP